MPFRDWITLECCDQIVTDAVSCESGRSFFLLFRVRLVRTVRELAQGIFLCAAPLSSVLPLPLSDGMFFFFEK